MNKTGIANLAFATTTLIPVLMRTVILLTVTACDVCTTQREIIAKNAKHFTMAMP